MNCSLNSMAAVSRARTALPRRAVPSYVPSGPRSTLWYASLCALERHNRARESVTLPIEQQRRRPTLQWCCHAAVPNPALRAS